MSITRRTLLGTSAALAALPATRARAQSAKIRVGVLTDMSGPYRDNGGPGEVACAQLAINEFKAAGHGIAVDLISADHQNKPDIGAGIARQWFDRDGVDMLIGVPNSGVGLAVAGVANEKNKVYINAGAGTSDLTGKRCNANTIHWTYDTWMLAHSTGGALVKLGGDSWFFITADYNFGHALQRDATTFIEAQKGKVLGSVSYPFPGTTDFSSFLLQAQASGSKVVGFCNAGLDTVNSIKQAHEFGIAQTLAGLLVFITDVHALTLDVAHGLVVSETFYWDLNDRTRAFSKRLEPLYSKGRACMEQAGSYGGTVHYLKAVAAMGATQAKVSGTETVAKMKSIPTDDDCFGPGSIRVDGRTLHACYLFEVKAPGDSKYPWDYYKLLATTPADQAFRPLTQGGCSLVKA